jgi:DNA repair exonuclease SbcCD nuclease subunit
MVRFIHSSDLHLGKRFGNFSGDLPGRLREARHAVLGKLAGQARLNGVDTILLAGDTFDTETPAADVRRQALTEMAHHAPLRWVILPGNHDSLQATELWNLLGSEAPGNVVDL